MKHDYRAAFIDGHTYNELVGAWLADHGVACTVPALELAGSPEERAGFTAHEKDIVLDGGRVLEVKAINKEFTWHPDSFPASELIVDTVNGYAGKAVKPIAYVFVSRSTGAMLALSTVTETKWWGKRLYDKYRNLQDDFLIADSRYLRPMVNLAGYIVATQAQPRWGGGW